MPFSILGVVILVLWIAALADVIVSDEHGVRHLPKFVWLLIVIIIPLAGSIIWFAIGRPEGSPLIGQRSSAPQPRTRNVRTKPAHADDDEEFLREVRLRAEEQRRKYREQHGDGDNPVG